MLKREHIKNFFRAWPSLGGGSGRRGGLPAVILPLTAALLLTAGLTASAQKVRKLHLLQDDAQQTMVTKVYDLKYVLANDITPFVLGAIKRYNTNSNVDRLNYAYGKKTLLVVSAPSDLIPYIDEIVRKIDRPAPKDANGSIVTGDGISRFVYMPNFRSTSDIAYVLDNLVRDADGAVYFDNSSNLVYWKDAAVDGLEILKWAKAFDRPIPQVELAVTIYEVRKSVLDDIGVDYLAWKNGPGMNLFAVGFQTAAVDSVEKSLADMNKFTSYAYGGFFSAPQFDASFIRLLSQAGSAKVTGSGSITVTNNYSRTFSLSISPETQNLQKDTALKTSIVPDIASGFSITVVNPVICYRQNKEGEPLYDGRTDKAVYETLKANIQFKYSVVMNNVTERNNRGSELTQQNSLQSSLTVDTGAERLLAAYTKKDKVEQVIGIPFLSDVPWLKYLVSTTTTADEDVNVFVTIKARLSNPQDSFPDWSGKIVRAEDIKLDL
jgi:type II secretory pathway component GspD/PulD (secretin)